MLVKKALLIIAIWWGLSLESIASQEKITGSSLTKLVIDHLNEEGLSAQPIINKNRVFTGCSKDEIIISKRDGSWKTINLRCKTNKSWNYNFRNKLPTANYAQNINKSHNLSENKSSQAKVEVLILKNSKLKGDRIEKTDLILSKKKAVLSKGAFSDFESVLGKRLIKNLQKGATLKTNHLKPDWLVHKNQKIIIEHKIGEIYVKMEAIALSNGAKGDRILAKNISSKKIVEGFVEDSRKISIFRKIY
jgi:flagella basal body P-ring formation protein FlgA